MDQTTGMSAAAPPPPPATRGRRRWFRFSLLTLLLFVLLIGSGMGLWRKWEPWVLEQAIAPYERNGDLEYSPNGDYVLNDGAVPKPVGGAMDSTALAREGVGLLDARTGAPLGFFKALGAIFSSDSRTLVTLDGENEVSTWSLPSLRRASTFRMGARWVSTFDLSSDGCLLATGAPDGSIRLWRVMDGCQALAFFEPNRFLRQPKFSQDGKRLLAHDLGNCVCVWDLRSDRRLCTISTRVALCQAGFDGRSGMVEVLTTKEIPPRNPAQENVGFNRWIEKYDAETGTLVSCVSANLADFNCTASDGRVVYCSWELPDDEGRVRVMDGKEKVQPGPGYSAPISGCKAVLYSGPLEFQAVISPNGDDVVGHPVHGGNPIFFWYRRRPEYWWGLAWLPEFWLTILFAGGFVWCVWRDRRTL